ncbi:UNVERIFIED_CONTAM: hypothetical protein GTU68_010696 [Idotea baltica]|nr:hypothetical protein [Idotea baltica]
MLINCDLGECLTDDPDLHIMPLIDQASIACGGHVGDALSMDKTVALAKSYHVSIGAHPSYPDKAQFGRVSMAMSLPDLFCHLLNQVQTLTQACQRHQVSLDYIKPHGALYHDMMQQPAIFALLCDVVQVQQGDVKLMVQAGINGQKLMAIAKDKDVPLLFEAFADRAYDRAALRPRTEKGAVLLSPEDIVAQYQQLSVSTDFTIDTICFHSDHAPSVLALKAIKSMIC